jgi:8-oxo-dGTP diphosphatase
MALCHVIKNGSLLLVKSPTGINKNKWNAANGDIANGEHPNKCAVKNLYQQTGMYSEKVQENGTVRLFLDGKNEASYKLHIYSTRNATGDIKPNPDGEVKWFGFTDIPYYDMWPDDKYWLPLVMQGKQFDADFFFDEKNENVLKYQIRERQHVMSKALPIIALVAIIAIAAFLITTSGVLKSLSFTNKNPVLTPPKNSNTVTNTSTSSTATTVKATTSIPAPPVPTKIQIDNIDLTLNYSGPARKQGVYCNVPSKTEVIGYQRTITSGQFLMNITFTDGGCNETITNIYTSTPGFSIVSVQPPMPTELYSYSNIYFDLKFVSTNKNFTGPLAITESYH